GPTAPATSVESFQPGPMFPGNERTILTSSPTAKSVRARKATTPAEAPVPGSGLAGVMPSTMMPPTPLMVPRVPLTAYVPVSPLQNLGSASATEVSALSEALSSYRLPSTSNCGRLCVPDAAAVPVKVSPSVACKPTAEPTSATSATETI